MSNNLLSRIDSRMRDDVRSVLSSERRILVGVGAEAGSGKVLPAGSNVASANESSDGASSLHFVRNSSRRYVTWVSMVVDLYVFLAFTFTPPKLWPSDVRVVVQAPLLALPFEIFMHAAFW